jgi:hypothetical protein
MLAVSFILFALLSQVFASSSIVHIDQSAKKALQEYARSHNLEQQWIDRVVPHLQEVDPEANVQLYHDVLFDFLNEATCPEGFDINCNGEKHGLVHWVTVEIKCPDFTIELTKLRDYGKWDNRMLITNTKGSTGYIRML